MEYVNPSIIKSKAPNFCKQDEFSKLLFTIEQQNLQKSDVAESSFNRIGKFLQWTQLNVTTKGHKILATSQCD